MHIKLNERIFRQKNFKSGVFNFQFCLNTIGVFHLLYWPFYAFLDHPRSPSYSRATTSISVLVTTRFQVMRRNWELRDRISKEWCPSKVAGGGVGWLDRDTNAKFNRFSIDSCSKLALRWLRFIGRPDFPTLIRALAEPPSPLFRLLSDKLLD